MQEFETMVRTLHLAGIEVILDVVYNHTCEGNHLGPTLSFRGIDNAAYYRLSPDCPVISQVKLIASSFPAAWCCYGSDERSS